MAADKGNLIDTSTAAALLKVTPRWIQQLAKDGWIKSAGRGKWSLVGVVQGYIDFLKDENARKTKSASQSAVQEARAEEIRRRIAREDRETIDVAEAVESFERATGEFIQSIAGLPARITRNPRERKRIEAICDAERQRITDRFAEIAHTLSTGIAVADPGDEDDA